MENKRINHSIMNKIIKSIFLLLIPLSVAGQLSPVTNQYVLNPMTINPAFAGGRGALNIAAFYRKQWTGITGAPETMTLSLDAPVLDSKLGLGLIITSDKLGVTKETQIKTAYAYNIKTGNGNLALGLGAGIITTNTAWSDLEVIDQGDEYYLIDSRTFVVPDFSFGIYYTKRNYFARLSIPKLLGYKFDFDRNKYSIGLDPENYYYVLNTGYLIDVSPKVKFLPSALLTYSQGDNLLYDINAHLSLYDRVWFGASYRNERSVTGLLQLSVNMQLKIAYTYDFDFGELGRYNNGSHEVMIRYVFRYRIDVVNPLIF